MYKIVIDTNIYISAIFWGGKPREIIDLARAGKLLAFTSSAIENEIADKLRTKFNLNKDEIERILTDFSMFTIPVDVSILISAIPDDPEDNKFVECALMCNSDYIISGDKHLLSVKEYAGIKIIRASEILSILSKI